jgi:hypothetical protein
MKPIRVKQLNNWREFPDNQGDSKTKAMGSPKKRIVYVVKGKTTQSEKLHEIGHIVKGHSNSWNYKANNYIKEEIEANLYSYKRVGKPSHIHGLLRGLLLDLIDHYKLSNKKSMQIIGHWVALSKVKSWKEDYTELAKEVGRYINKKGRC